MDECRAAVVVSHNEPLEIQKVPIPELEPGALLVRIEASTICGTDVHRWHGPLGGGDSLPIITGHEPCGYIEEIMASVLLADDLIQEQSARKAAAPDMEELAMALEYLADKLESVASRLAPA